MGSKPDNKESSQLLLDESFEGNSRPIFRLTWYHSSYEIVQEILGNPGRFRSPLSFIERIKLGLYAAGEVLDRFSLKDNFFFPLQRYQIPYSWQILLRYLEKEGLLEKAEFLFSRFEHDQPKMFSTTILQDEKGEQNKGFGSTGDFELTLSKTVGEFLERFFLAVCPSDRLASPQELRTKRISFLSPQALSQFSEEQKERFSRFRISADQKLSWTKGRALFSQKEVLIPTQVLSRGDALKLREPILRDTNSNGSAGHFTLKEALLAGIYENVERDSFLVYWLNTIAPPVLDTSSIKHPELQALLQKLERYRFEVKFLNTTTDIGIPSFLCVLIDRSEKGPRVAIGGGSGFDITAALLSAAREASSVHNSFATQEVAPAPTEDLRPFSDTKLRRHGRILLWQNPLMFPRILPFLEGKTQTLEEAFPDLPVFRSFEEEYQYVTKLFQSLGTGYEIYFYEVKHRVLDTLGYHVVKVVIPELIHLYLNEAFAPLGARRLKDVPVKLGYTPSAQWNPWPHPFP